MNDRELLALAAKAAGLNLAHCPAWKCMAKELHDLDGSYFDVNSRWNPLTNDGDALRLAVKLGMCVTAFTRTEDTMVGYLINNDDGRNIEEAWADDPYAATRRAIVRAAAEIGRDMK